MIFSSIGDGYSNLFEFLCSNNQIECLVVHGHSKARGYKVGDKFEGKDTNHAWNVAKFDNKW